MFGTHGDDQENKMEIKAKMNIDAVLFWRLDGCENRDLVLVLILGERLPFWYNLLDSRDVWEISLPTPIL